MIDPPGKLDPANGNKAPLSWQYVAAAVVLLAGTVLSVALFVILRHIDQNHLDEEFSWAARNRTMLLQKEIDGDALVLKALGGFFDGSKKVERDEFRDFATPLLQYHSDIQVLQWAPRVPRSQRGDFEAAARREGLSGFRITGDGNKARAAAPGPAADYFPVYFVVPRQGNEAALGLDLASEATALEALDRSAESGLVRATGRLVLPSPAGPEYGFMLVLPIYRKNATLDSMESRRENLKGFVAAYLRIGKTIKDALKPLNPRGLDMYLTDESAPPRERFLCFWPSRTRTKPPPPAAGRDGPPPATDLQSATILEAGGRKWSLVCAATPEFIAARMSWHPWGALLGGLALSALLAGYLFSVGARNAKMARMADQLAATNKELRRQAAERKQAQDKLRRSEGVLQAEVAQRRRTEEELRKRMAELEKFNRLAVGRELRMIELKGEVNRAAAKAGFEQPYDLSFASSPPAAGGDKT